MFRLRTPGHADVGRQVVPLRVVGMRADGERIVNRGLAGQSARLKEIARTGDAEERVVGGLRETVVESDVWELHFPAQAVIDGQVGLGAPAILSIKAGLALLIALGAGPDVDILARFVE